MPPRSIALEWFRMGVYVWWKQLPQCVEIELEKFTMNRKGQEEISKVVRHLNIYKVEGFSVHRPENFQVDLINQKRDHLLEQLKVRVIKVNEIIEETNWFAKTVWIDGALVYVLSQSDASKLDDKFICVEVF
jgi:hypothetical protein